MNVERHEPTSPKGLVQHYLKDLVYGANDGTITTFAVVSGVAGASLDPRVVVILGVANLLADGFSMGASNFLAIRSDESVRRSQNKAAIEPFPFRHALATFLAFLLVGSVPLLSYLMPTGDRAFPIAVVLTLSALFGVGAARALVSDVRWWLGGLEMLGVGAVASAVAYATGAWISGLL
jgi:VIT1/CCC1 family predicted Fe2+/Mn2+ transporter